MIGFMFCKMLIKKRFIELLKMRVYYSYFLSYGEKVNYLYLIDIYEKTNNYNELLKIIKYIN